MRSARIPLIAGLLLLSAGVLPAQTSSVARLRIFTSPEGAAVTMNGAYAGKTPLDLIGLAPGPYSFVVRLGGYRDEEFLVNTSAGSSRDIRLALKPLAGSVDIRVDPADAEISIDDAPAASGRTELKAGIHAIRARKFGYEEMVSSVSVADGSVRTVEFELVRAPLRIEALSSSRSAFNPLNPGDLGRARFAFRVSAPARLVARVLSASGATIAEIPLAPPAARDCAFSWDGRGAEGEPVADGVYRVVVSAEAEDPASSGKAEAELAIRIDSGLDALVRASSAMASGFALCPDASTLPPGSLEARIDALAPLSQPNGFPAWASFRAGIARGLEAGGSARIVAGSEGWGIEASAKYRFMETGGTARLRAAAFLRGAMASASGAGSWMAGGDRSGVSLGLPFSLALGRIDFVISPIATLAWIDADALPSAGAAAALGLQYARFDVHASASFVWDIPSASGAPLTRIGIDARYLSSSLLSLGLGALLSLEGEPSVAIAAGAGFIF